MLLYPKAIEVNHFPDTRTMQHIEMKASKQNTASLFNPFTTEFHKVDSFMLKIGQLHFSYNWESFIKSNVSP